MQEELRLVSVSDGYIDFLIRNGHEHVYSNKENRRIVDRPYVGVVLRVADHQYYVPLSSPKDRDFVISKAGQKTVRPDTFLVMRIIDGRRLLGTIHFGNMIPVPPSSIIPYDIANERDSEYKRLMEKEVYFLRKHTKAICSRAKTVYNKRIYNGLPQSTATHCLDFSALENLCDLWKKTLGSGSIEWCPDIPFWYLKFSIIIHSFPPFTAVNRRRILISPYTFHHNFPSHFPPYLFPFSSRDSRFLTIFQRPVRYNIYSSISAKPFPKSAEKPTYFL